MPNSNICKILESFHECKYVRCPRASYRIHWHSWPFFLHQNSLLLFLPRMLYSSELLLSAISDSAHRNSNFLMSLKTLEYKIYEKYIHMCQHAILLQTHNAGRLFIVISEIFYECTSFLEWKISFWIKTRVLMRNFGDAVCQMFQNNFSKCECVFIKDPSQDIQQQVY